MAGTRLRVDPVACDGVGICGYQAPELIRVDSWGFPVLPPGPVRPDQLAAAARAVAACPRRALFLDRKVDRVSARSAAQRSPAAANGQPAP